jgi:two-component system chemotaxis sensor kinase CheA
MLNEDLLMLNVLYVEDDANSRAVLSMIARIQPDFMALTLFEDSADFAARLAALSPQPDLILLDIHVEPHDGFVMLRQIRALPAFDTTPVVALTASVMNDEVQVLQDAGFSGVVSKPLNLEMFPALIQRIIDGEVVWYVW